MIVGQLYPRTDPRRDPAYTIFYMGINLGAALGAVLCGYLGETYGWSYGFGAAGIGMLFGLAVFMWGKPLLMGKGEAPDPVRLTRRVGGVTLEWRLYLVGIAGVGDRVVARPEPGPGGPPAGHCRLRPGCLRPLYGRLSPAA